MDGWRLDTCVCVCGEPQADAEVQTAVEEYEAAPVPPITVWEAPAAGGGVGDGSVKAAESPSQSPEEMTAQLNKTAVNGWMDGWMVVSDLYLMSSVRWPSRRVPRRKLYSSSKWRRQTQQTPQAQQTPTRYVCLSV